MLSLGWPLLIVMMGGIGLPGGAVYINEGALRSPLWRTMVSLAGPAANLLLAIVIGLIFRFAPPPVDGGGPALAFIGMLQISAVLLNLLPIPPLDGYGALSPHLDPNTRRSMDSFAGWGFFAIFFMLWFVPPVNAAFWSAVYNVCNFIGIPVELAVEGLHSFRFWRQ
jgi:Zn-dependent protease